LAPDFWRLVQQRQLLAVAAVAAVAAQSRHPLTTSLNQPTYSIESRDVVKYITGFLSSSLSRRMYR
jgi:hypothetical protein